MAKKFARRIDDAHMRIFQAAAQSPGVAWWPDLLRLWTPSGQEVGKTGLRLAIRDGYLNFYSCGQSIAKVSSVKGQPSVTLHSKYIGRESDDYVRMRGTEVSVSGNPRVKLGDYTGPAMLREWIALTEKHRGHEKRHLDAAVATNGLVIDLEMGLPGKADRIDLVALEETGDRLDLVFWEAKLINSGELKSRSESPKILGLMRRYRDFLRDNELAIRDAYTQTCSFLVELAAMAASAGNPIALPRPILDVASRQRMLSVDEEPRLLLFEARDIRRGKNWDAHEAKLRANGVRLTVFDGANFSGES